MDVNEFNRHADALVEAGHLLHARGWVPATSGNFSSRINDEQMAITASGWHKGDLSREGILRADLDGNPLEAGKRPSAETLLHCQLYNKSSDIGAVLHTHSMNATLVSRLCDGELVLEDYELLKAFDGITTHAYRMVIPVFPNDQDIARLADRVEAWMDGHPAIQGYLIAGHGLYTWGRDLREALHYLEAFDFLFACEIKLHEMGRR
jgi:methylthioribulose-1-phosphate dehydratase